MRKYTIFSVACGESCEKQENEEKEEEDFGTRDKYKTVVAVGSVAVVMVVAIERRVQ